MKGESDTTEMRDTWLAIVDPAAGERRAGDDWPRIGALLKNAGIRYEAVFTEHKYHAVELTVSAINSGIRHIIVVGGTTLLHEVVNGVFIQHAAPTDEVHLGIISVCTPGGNDGIPDIPEEYPEAIVSIASGYFSLEAFPTVIYQDSSVCQERHMACSARGGIEAVLSGRLLQMNEEGRRNLFLKWITAAKSVLGYPLSMVRIAVDGTDALSGRVSGIRISSVFRDGSKTLEVSIANRPARLLSILHAHHLCKGLTAAKFTHTICGSHIKIESSPAIPIYADGEFLGYSPAEFRIFGKGVRVAVRKTTAPKSADSRSNLRTNSAHPYADY